MKSSISLTDQQDAFARGLVETGRYSSMSAVIQQALDLLKQKTESEEADTRALKLLLERRASGPFVTPDEMRDRLDAMVERKRREYGVED